MTTGTWSRPDDGDVDHVAVELAARGESTRARPVPLSGLERLAAARLILAGGGSPRRVAARLHISAPAARRLAAAVAQEQVVSQAGRPVAWDAAPRGALLRDAHAEVYRRRRDGVGLTTELEDLEREYHRERARDTRWRSRCAAAHARLVASRQVVT